MREEKDRIVWLRKIMPGGTDRSYGIEVARLAGLPHGVIDRASEILKDLETNGTGNKAVGKGAKVTERKEKLQMTLFETDKHPVLEELAALDTSVMSPIEAMNKLYELQKKATCN